MCHCAASAISQGHNVLYITMEMAEERIAERIDANLLNVTMDELHVIPKDDYNRKFSALKNKTQGKLIIKEYPTASAHAGHFRALLQELRLKKNFVPEIIMKIISTANNSLLAKRIASSLDLEHINCDVEYFSDQEIKVSFNSFIISSLL
jgi:hypothetical protein